ncbi:hypothetical protein HDU76_013681 [Blyttiomyces sp. JEL0837]|nr:hypothetical protein HDU76_013681 [Blyttiomyces sp. JEL0837]
MGGKTASSRSPHIPLSSIKSTGKVAPTAKGEDATLPSYANEQQNILSSSESVIAIKACQEEFPSPQKQIVVMNPPQADEPPTRRISLQHRIAQHIDSRVQTVDGIPTTSRSSYHKSYQFIDFIEQTVVVLDLETINPESIGICGIASMTSDLFAKLTAAVIVYILLGYNSIAWSECRGVVDLTTLTSEVCSTILVTLLIEIPYTIYEMKDVGYDLRVVVETMDKVKLGWTLYAFLICAAGSCLSTFITAEVQLFQDSTCFKKD